MVSPRATADLIVIGDGLIGLSTAVELARAGATVRIIGSPHAGAASTAAAGLLIPSLDRLPGAARPFFSDSLDRFPTLVESLREFDPSLAILSGVIERTSAGDILHEHDGAIDNVRLTNALRASVASNPKIAFSRELVGEVSLAGQTASVITTSGTRVDTGRVVLAAGAWAAQIRGLPRPLPVRPLKGQMIALGASPLERATMGDVYLVPRGGETIVGATVEEAEFDITVTDAGIESLRRSAIALCPELANAPVTRSWAGSRPATPDMLPILGADPAYPTLVYACGHSKNGVLLTPATGVAISAVCLGKPTPTQIDAFAITRFSER